MPFCIAGICAGLAIVWVFPTGSVLSRLGTLLFAGAAVVLLVLLVRSLTHSAFAGRLWPRQALAAVVLVLIAGLFARELLPEGDSAQIERTIESVYASTDPAYCDELVTPRYLKQVTGQSIRFADEICEREAVAGGANAVAVSEIEIDGRRATATADNRGGSLDGSQIEVSLIEEEGTWRLNSLNGFAHFDRGRFRHAYLRKLRRLGFPTEAARCVLAMEARLSDSDVKRALIARHGNRVFARLIVACDRKAAQQRFLNPVTSSQLDPTEREVRCAERDLSMRSGDALVRLLVDEAGQARLLIGCARNSVNDYYRRELLGSSELSRSEATCATEALTRLSDTAFLGTIHDEDAYRGLVDACER